MRYKNHSQCHLPGFGAQVWGEGAEGPTRQRERAQDVQELGRPGGGPFGAGNGYYFEVRTSGPTANHDSPGGDPWLAISCPAR